MLAFANEQLFSHFIVICRWATPSQFTRNRQGISEIRIHTTGQYHNDKKASGKILAYGESRNLDCPLKCLCAVDHDAALWRDCCSIIDD